MLKAPDKHTKELLDHANFIENLDPDRFSMATWGEFQEPRCICGWYQYLHGHINKDDWENAAKGLGLDRETASRLFAIHNWNNKQAAQALRELAVTA